MRRETGTGKVSHFFSGICRFFDRRVAGFAAGCHPHPFIQQLPHARHDIPAANVLHIANSHSQPLRYDCRPPQVSLQLDCPSVSPAGTSTRELNHLIKQAIQYRLVGNSNDCCRGQSLAQHEQASLGRRLVQLVGGFVQNQQRRLLQHGAQ